METVITYLPIVAAILLAMAGLGIISLIILAIIGGIADENEKLNNQ